MKAIIIGAGGHARVVYDILRHDRNITVESFVDNTRRGSDEDIMGVQVTGDHSVIPSLIEDGVNLFIIAVGDNDIRQDHFETLREHELRPVNAVHPSAEITPTAKLGTGSVFAASSNVSTNAVVGNNVIINTDALVEHETEVHDHAHIGPGSKIAGRVEVGDGAFIGIGTTIKEYVTIGKGAIVGAGSVVLDDVPANTVAAGAPAEVKRERDTDGTTN
ncbi:acetyltransferase [Halorubrum sp. SD626R]|uniref:acetyltransferase n=1 Tax=Halorubrum sp. SD626R TaxID=1419722 RepID=UPI000AC02CB0|nr:acetyltransferase [Halorubrum sp. SD626R]TKX82268.1 acetyltransferase [Halorubrum sp. SD626R]